MDKEALIHFIGGAIGGTVGTAMTCPFEVVKTRMQSSEHCSLSKENIPAVRPDNYPTVKPSSSSPTVIVPKNSPGSLCSPNTNGRLMSTPPFSPSTVQPSYYSRFFHLFKTQGKISTIQDISQAAVSVSKNKLRIVNVVREVYKEGGIRAFYKGLFPNLIGVAPSKAIYFWCYSTNKRNMNHWCRTGILRIQPDSAAVHMVSAGFAGFVTATSVNPIWLVKTRLQLSHVPLRTITCISNIYKNEGIRAFWKGVTASYIGISETIIQFVAYEYLRQTDPLFSSEKINFSKFMLYGGLSKFIACLITYPHEVLRTRLREERAKSAGVLRTFRRIFKERAQYRGFIVQLMRAVPNTALTMGAYEIVIHVLHGHINLRDSDSEQGDG